MAIEIERKYLVIGSGWKQSPSSYYRQGYLNLDKERTVRVRETSENVILTVKGLTTGIKRLEFEYIVPKEDSEGLFSLCVGAVVEKNRYRVPYQGLVWEVDEFLGENAGLVIAEVELEAEDQEISLPEWIGAEVTGERQYYNSSLVTNPFVNWTA